MISKLDIKTDSYFFKDYARTNTDSMIYYGKNRDYINAKKYHHPLTYQLYKKQYISYYFHTKLFKHKKATFETKDIPLKKPISSLTLWQDHIIKEIKSLPKTLKVLWFQGFTEFGWKLNPKVLPKSLVSLTFRWCWSPLQGSDLSHLTNLKLFYADGSSTSLIPKFPKSIVVISMQDNPTLFFAGVDFKLSDYPNLEYVDFRGSIDKKRVPKEWKQAKKAGKIDIKW